MIKELVQLKLHLFRQGRRTPLSHVDFYQGKILADIEGNLIDDVSPYFGLPNETFDDFETNRDLDALPVRPFFGIDYNPLQLGSHDTWVQAQLYGIGWAFFGERGKFDIAHACRPLYTHLLAAKEHQFTRLHPCVITFTLADDCNGKFDARSDCGAWAVYQSAHLLDYEKL